MAETDPSSAFGYSYFDEPQGLGYRGYHKDHNGDTFLPWAAAAQFCIERGVRTAADLGCAKGFLVEALTHAGVKAVGFDVSEYALTFAKGLPCFRWNIVDGIPVAVDAVFALGVLCYVPEGRLPEVLRDVRASTRSYLLFTTFYAGESQDVPDHLRTITRGRRWWLDHLAEAGFVCQERAEAFDVFTVR